MSSRTISELEAKFHDLNTNQQGNIYYIRCGESKNRKKIHDLFSMNILSKVYVQNFK